MKDYNLSEVLETIKDVGKSLRVESEKIEDIVSRIESKYKDNHAMINIGDVVMKDNSIVEPKYAKDKLDEVFGIVFYINGSDVRFMALEKSEDSLMFKTENTLVPKHLPLYENGNIARKDLNGKMNSEIIKNAPDFTKEKYPSMAYCMDYNRFVFDKGMWYLPSIGELEQIYDSKAELNKTLKILGKKEIYNGWYTSSSDCCTEWCWWFDVNDNIVNYGSKNDYGWVRPCFSIII